MDVVIALGQGLGLAAAAGLLASAPLAAATTAAAAGWLRGPLAIADDGIFLDADSKTPIAHGSPSALRDSSTHPTVRAFLAREELPAKTVTSSPS